MEARADTERPVVEKRMEERASHAMKIELCVHAWRYPRLFCYQATSLLAYSPLDYELIYTVYYCPDEDIRTRWAVDYFSGIGAVNLEWNLVPLEKEQLCRRAIGRNRTALSSQADWIWFCDVDYICGSGCLDALPAELEKVKGPLAYPRITLRSKTHLHGDAAIERVSFDAIVDYQREVELWGIGRLFPSQTGYFPNCRVHIDPADFEPYRNRRAIGGIQLVRGDVCRQRGYLRDHARYLRPAARWRRTYEDTAFRRSLGTAGEPIDVPNLYHIRHSQRGRDHEGVEL